MELPHLHQRVRELLEDHLLCHYVILRWHENIISLFVPTLVMTWSSGHCCYICTYYCTSERVGHVGQSSDHRLSQLAHRGHRQWKGVRLRCLGEVAWVENAFCKHGIQLNLVFGVGEDDLLRWCLHIGCQFIDATYS